MFKKMEKIIPAVVDQLIEPNIGYEYVTQTSMWDRHQIDYFCLALRCPDLKRYGGNPANQKRLHTLRKQTQRAFPLLEFVDVQRLYFLATIRQREYHQKYKNHPNETTRSELNALRELKSLFSNRKIPLVYANYSFNNKKWQKIPSKLTFGPHVPDFVLFGIRPAKMNKRYFGIILEINGEVHNFKAAKDDLLKQHAEEHGLYVMDIENSVLNSPGKLQSMFNSMIDRGELVYEYDHELIKKRYLMFMLRTIACWLDHQELDDYFRRKNPNVLFDHLFFRHELLKLRNCPKKIKRLNVEDLKNAKMPSPLEVHLFSPKPEVGTTIERKIILRKRASRL